MKARRLQSLLQRKLGYVVVRSVGSHRRLEAPGHPPLTLAFHDGATIGPALVRRILTRGVGLTLEEAQEVVRDG